ncbi:MAG: plasmid replication protein, CyRepA1 family, partial [Waterburya sp.]
HYYLTVGRPYLIERDSRQLRAISHTNRNRLWLPDFNRSLLSTPLRLLETLIIGLLKPGRTAEMGEVSSPIASSVEYRGSDANLQFIAELALANQRELKTFLGLTIVESDTPIKIVQKLLSLLGLKLTCIGRLGSRGQRERVYVFEPPDDGREEIFKSWLRRDSALAQVESTSNFYSVSTIGKENNLSQSVDSKMETEFEQKEQC